MKIDELPEIPLPAGDREGEPMATRDACETRVDASRVHTPGMSVLRGDESDFSLMEAFDFLVSIGVDQTYIGNVLMSDIRTDLENRGYMFDDIAGTWWEGV